MGCAGQAAQDEAKNCGHSYHSPGRTPARSITALISVIRASSRFRTMFFDTVGKFGPIEMEPPGGGGEPVSSALARASACSSDSRVGSCHATTRKPARSSFSRVASGGNRKLMLLSFAHGVG